MENTINKLNENFPSTYQFCKGNLNRFIMLLEEKGVYPYEYMDNWEKCNEISLPPKKIFYSELNLKNITDKNYACAKKVWGVFEIRNLGEYQNLYVQTDTFLADIEILEICILIYMNLILYILYLHLD